MCVHGCDVSRYYRLRKRCLVFFHKCLRPGKPPMELRDFKEYLYDQQFINMFSHIANFTSLVTYTLALLWFRFGYNAPVFPFSSAEVSSDEFWRLLQ